MKIYQIHEYGGEWEDKYDYIVGSYLSEKKAIIKKEQLEKEEKIRQKCNSCPLYYCQEECDNNCDGCLDRSIQKIKTYCNKYEPFNKKEGSMKCINFTHNYEESYFRIEEVEVIE